MWFRPTAIKGFSAVHWKGPVVAALLGVCFVLATFVAITTSEHHTIISAISGLMALAILIGGHVLLARHEEDD